MSTTKSDIKKIKPVKRGGGPKALGTSVTRVAKPILGKRGFSDGAIITRWPEIVGPVLAQHTLPTKIAFPRGSRDHGTLHLTVEGGAFATELQHLQPLLLERINSFFGYRAVNMVRIAQGPLPKKADEERVDYPPLPPDLERALTSEIAGVEDLDLRDSLTRLGRALKQRKIKNTDDIL